MYVSEVIKFYGSLIEAAKALGISRIAIRKWGKVVPAESAIRLHEKSGGALKIDASVYERLAAKRYKSQHVSSKRASAALTT